MKHLKENQTVPNILFRTRENGEWVNIDSNDIFRGKSVIVFSLPGAFTPTCSSSHVPRYNQLASAFKSHGIDEIICISVNDAFVMNQWQIDQKADRIHFLPDGNGDFTREMGMLVDKGDLGFGQRSWRYSMLVRDGAIEKLFVEQEVPGDPFSVSDADTMLSYIAPGKPKPLDVTLFTRSDCPFCTRVKGLLHDAKIEFEELELNKHFTDRTLRAVARADTFPQVFICGENIGGAEELQNWLGLRQAA